MDDVFVLDIDAEFGGTDWAGMEQADLKEVEESNLIPKGRWVGTLQSDSRVQTVTTEEGNHPLEGKAVVQCHVLLTMPDETSRHFFFPAYPQVVTATSRNGGTYMRQESRHAGYLYSATGLVGRPFAEVLKYAMTHELVYHIGIRAAKNDYPAQNILRGITAVEGA